VLGAVALLVAVASVDYPRGVPDAEMVAWWADDGNRAADLASTMALLASGLLYLGFFQQVTRRVAIAGAEGAARLAQQAATLFVAMLFTAGFGGAVTRGIVVDDEPVPGADVLRVVGQLRYTAMGVFAMAAAALAVGCITWAAFRHRAVPPWLAGLGVLMIAGVTAGMTVLLAQFAIPLLIVWTIGCSVVLLREEQPSPTAVGTARVPATR